MLNIGANLCFLKPYRGHCIPARPEAFPIEVSLSSTKLASNSDDQEVVAKAHPLRMRGLKAYRFAGAIRTLAQLLRRVLTFVLDVTYTLGKEPVAQT